MFEMDLLIAGSLAYDTLESESGRVDDVLGGSATYAALSARFHMKEGRIGLVGVVGNDFRNEDWEMLSERSLDLSGVEKLEGSTFRWHGKYPSGDHDAITLETHMNVVEKFEPHVPDHKREPSIFLCANLHPRLQEELLSQVSPKVLIVDTMNKWITGNREQLCRVLSKTQIAVMNSTELKMLTGQTDVEDGAHSLLRGTCLNTDNAPEIVVVKLGSDGAVSFGPWGRIECSGHKVETVVDPTGCGDVFAGAMAAHLINSGVNELPNREEMLGAIEHANRTASFNLEEFGVIALKRLNQHDYLKRI